MSGNFLLDWAILAVSIFNTILLFWLGLTVLLNAERRSGGLWLAGGAMLLGGLFFFSHTAIVGASPFFFSIPLDFWWHVGWVPVLCLPFAWYSVMLWYNGFWDNRASALYRRHRLGFALTLILALGTLLALIFFNPLPSANQLVQYEIDAEPSIGGVPLLILAYPFYSLLCIGLSLDVLRRPAPTPVVMGDLARRRARPWLVAVSLGLFAVSLLVGAAVGWILLALPSAGTARSGLGYQNLVVTIAWYDLVIASLIALITLLVGQAVVAYEVFTGTTLPRRGLLRYWQRAIILAAGFGVLVSLGLRLSVQPVHLVLLATLLITVFYALLSSRSYQERQRYIDSLRPFISSQEVYARILAQNPGDAPGTEESHEDDTFQALCRDLLGASRGYLIPLGTLAALAGPAAAYPTVPAAGGSQGEKPSSSSIDALLARLKAQGHAQLPLCQPISPDEEIARDYAGAAWAVPLWNAAGLSGLLLLGEKTDGSLYTQEEIEVARTAGEHLLDARASAELARRLAALQRQHISQSQVVDRRTRRVLHDDVLPELHAAMLALSATQEPQKQQEGLKTLAAVHGQIASLLRELPPAAPNIHQPGLLAALRLLLEREHPQDFDRVDWQVDPQVESRLADLPAWMAEVLYYAAREAVRNAARHARGARPEAALHLAIGLQWQESHPATAALIIEDNGVGLPASSEILPAGHPPLSAGSGQGLALHSTLMAVIGGALELSSQPGLTRVTLTLPV